MQTKMNEKTVQNNTAKTQPEKAAFARGARQKLFVLLIADTREKPERFRQDRGRFVNRKKKKIITGRNRRRKILKPRKK